MIISHRHRYLFVELPRSGSTAISRELRANYDGRPILKKHSTYEDFRKTATSSELTYFVFSSIRNPMDEAVSRYFKLMTDHRSQYTDPRKVARRRTLPERLERRAFAYVQEAEPSFPEFFLRFYRVPYANWSILSHRRFDFLIRFDRIVEDFDGAIRAMGLVPVRPLPAVNQTSNRRRTYADYYTEDTIERALHVFGPFMEEWGFEFPKDWGKVSVPAASRMQYRALNLARRVYWKHLRYRV